MKANDNTVAIPDKSEVIETPIKPRRCADVSGSISVPMGLRRVIVESLPSLLSPYRPIIDHSQVPKCMVSLERCRSLHLVIFDGSKFDQLASDGAEQDFVKNMGKVPHYYYLRKGARKFLHQRLRGAVKGKFRLNS